MKTNPALITEAEGAGPGLACPKCGCRHLPVWYTRQRPAHILRVRKCRHCGRRVTTRERI